MTNKKLTKQISLAPDEAPHLVATIWGPDTEKRTPWEITLEWGKNNYGDEEENARARCCAIEMQYALTAAARRSVTRNKRKWAIEDLGIPLGWLDME